MDKRLVLNSELLKFVSNVYFQPPSNIQMTYPCIVYSKTGKARNFANNGVFLSQQEYRLMVIDRSPDSAIADNIEGYFTYCAITGYYTVDELNHTTLSLYY